MPANPSSTANLPCEQCGYLNEPERVYCHNCGQKLDRSLLPKSEQKKQEAPEKTRKRISKITNPASGGIGREVKTLFKTIIYAAIVAAIILIAQPPDAVPDPKKVAADRLVSGDMMDALESPTPRPISFTEDEASDFLKRKLKKKEDAIPGVEFTRAYVRFLPGELRIFSEYSLWGYPVYPGVYYQVEVKDGKFTTKIVGGTIGRLSVDPQLMQHVSVIFGSLWASLQPERKQMDRLLSIKVLDKRIDLVTKGSPLR